MSFPSDSLFHIPVLLDAVVAGLSPKAGMTIVDGTLGLGGHARVLAEACGETGHLFGFDWDERNRSLAEKNLADIKNIDIIPAPFSHLQKELFARGVSQIDALLLDIGLSSAHIDDADRGFSFRFSGPLDMRMNTSATETAADFLARSSEEEIANILYRFGEEKRSRYIAKNIVSARKKAPILTTDALFRILESDSFSPKKTAARVFQALRIAVNGELDELESVLKQAKILLAPTGRIAVITFHSLEDRIVKMCFREWEKEGGWKRINKKVIVADFSECQKNPRARSAKLRLIEKKVIS